MSFRFLVFILAFIGLASARAQNAEPLGMVMDVQGAVNAVEPGKSVRLEMLSYLKPGMELDLARGASVALTWYAGSKEMRFTGPAKLKVTKERVDVLEGAGAKERSLGEEKVALGRSGMPPRLAQATVMMRGFKPGSAQEAPPALTAEQKSRLARLKPEAGAPFADRLRYALALEEMKQTDEARPIWKKLSEERPDEPKLKEYAER